jgi:hypothetical protein
MKKIQEKSNIYNIHDKITNSPSESASRPPCGFWRIDDQQLEVESFVVHDILKGDMNNELKILLSYNEEKGKSRKAP